MQNDLYYLLSLIPLIICLSYLGLKHLFTVELPARAQEKEFKKSFKTLLDFKQQWPSPIRSRLMNTISLFDISSLTPEPLATILTHIELGKPEKAIEKVLSYCTPFFIKRLMYRWRMSRILHYQKRRPHFPKAKKAFKEERYAECNQILLAQIEGAVTNWAMVEIGKGNPKRMIPDLRLKTPPSTKILNEVSDAVIQLLNYKISPEDWLDLTQSLFPNRDELSLTNEEGQEFDRFSSIRLFLLMDEVFFRKY